MKLIAFVDLEVQATKHTVMDIGATNDRGSVFHARSMAGLAKFLQGHDYLCGHNIVGHDLLYMKEALKENPHLRFNVIDTLYLSPLLFPKKPYHRLVKDEKLQSDELNNPLADAIKAKELLEDEVLAFGQLAAPLQSIFYELLRARLEFGAFFRYVDYVGASGDVSQLIREHFSGVVCARVNFNKIISMEPVALAYALAVLNVRDRFSVPPRWVLMQFPAVDWAMDMLRNRPCLEGCAYCDLFLDARGGLKRYFGFDDYRTFDSLPLQEQAVRAALNNKSLLAVFPTGGGKSVTFQVPALMAGENVKGLTVVISPLLSLMKDQVDNLEKAGITDAVTINGLLDPIERAKSLERIEDGSAAILYISPEALRSRTIGHLLRGRKIARFVIDEAHCFSAWGQDFRVDYLYIGEFIKSLQKDKGLLEGIPVSCFTATAKPKVIEDIKAYFKDKLGLELVDFTSGTTRPNLQFKVVRQASNEDKYITLRRYIEQRPCPTIVYVSRTRTADELAARLSQDGFPAKPYHGKMETRDKSAHQDDFMLGEVSIIVATSAFGMGVDKKDVGMVIHFEISGSLENYIQEAGRAGRDAQISADCLILFCEEDLDKHFVMLNQSKINIKEIQQVWKAIKDITRLRRTVSQSALEIARKAGWDEGIKDIETRVRTAITALEQSGYVKRGQNGTRVYANSILARNAEEAIGRINASDKFAAAERQDAVRVILRLISSKSQGIAKGHDSDATEHVDYIAEALGLPRERVMGAVTRLREEGILADTKDLCAYLRRTEQANKSLEILNACAGIENYLASVVDEQEEVVNLKELNENAAKAKCEGVSTPRIRTLLNYWQVAKLVQYAPARDSRNHVHVRALHARSELQQIIENRLEVARFIIEYLFAASQGQALVPNKEEILVQFSVHELKAAYETSQYLFKTAVSIKDIEGALFYLTKIDAVKLDGGFLVLYNPMTIERVEDDLKKRYTKEDYTHLQEHYESRAQQIHIVGAYAAMMVENYQAALQFVGDYFSLNYSRFLAKYFSGRKEEISRSITPSKFKQLFGELSPAQLKIITDKDSKNICVLAGPGSGKTRILVHKLASLILMEDVKYEQLLMLTFSRAAATEFKARLRKLVGSAANFIEIKTFHSYCFDLLGKVGSLEKSEEIIHATIQRIKDKDVEMSRIVKAVLVVDEAQDMDSSNYALIETLIEQNENMRVIMVGDDDQNIFQFRNSSSKYMAEFIAQHEATKYELLDNYRSTANVVHFANQFAASLGARLKQHEIIPRKKDNGQIKVVKYASNNLLLPFVDDIASADLIGATCVLTKTNDQALMATGMLLKQGIKAKLIQSNDQFKLYDLDEIRFFLRLLAASTTTMLDPSEWARAKKILKSRYQRSNLLDTCLRIIKAFEDDSRKHMYLSDFEAFIRESRLEDFYGDLGLGETIFVSTIHKAKGKEFDNVFLLLEGHYSPSADEKRQIYVALTRAKTNLSIHYNGRYLDNIAADNLAHVRNNDQYSEPDEVALKLTLSDVWLDYSAGRQEYISGLQSGDPLLFRDNLALTEKGFAVLKVSQVQAAQLETLKQKGYIPSGAKVNFVVWWPSKETGGEVKIVLPEIYLAKKL